MTTLRAGDLMSKIEKQGKRGRAATRKVRRAARLAEASGGKTRAILKLLGRGALLLAAGAFNLSWWVFGALFALFIGATSFTLVVRAFGTDQVIAGIIQRIPGGALGPVLAVMLLLWLCAFALDAFEIIFVIIPLVMPPLLTRVGDPVWVAVLALLALQSSFLLPPLGYAVMMARTLSPVRVDLHALVKALLPFLAAQLVVLFLTVAFPILAHLALPAEPAAFAPRHPLTDREIEQRLLQQLPASPYSDH